MDLICTWSRLQARREIRRAIEADGHFGGDGVVGWSEWLGGQHRCLPNPRPLADLLTRKALAESVWPNAGPTVGGWGDYPISDALVREMLECADRLATYGIEVGALRRWAESNGAARQLVLCRWIDAYRAEMDRLGYADRPSMMEALAGWIESQRRLPGSRPQRMTLVDFPEAPPLTVRLIRAVTDAGVSVVWRGAQPLGYDADEGGSVAEYYFQSVRAADRSLGRLERAFADCDRFELIPKPMDLEATSVQRFFAAHDRKSECAEIARRIRRIVAERPGLALGRIAVVFPNLETYRKPLQSALERARLPFYFRVGRRALEDPGVRWALSVAEWVAGGCRLEGYPTLATHRRMRSEDDAWPAAARLLNRFMIANHLASGPILRLAEGANPDKNADASACDRLCEDARGWSELASRWSEPLIEEEHQRRWREVLDFAGWGLEAEALDAVRSANVEGMERQRQTARQCGFDQTPIPAVLWLQRLRRALEQTTLYGYPREEDAVNGLSLEEAYGLDFDYVFLGGLGEGEFPETPRGRAFMTRGDWRSLGEAAPNPALRGLPDEDEEIALRFASLQYAAQREIVHSYAICDEKEEPREPSRYLRQAMRRAGEETIEGAQRGAPWLHPHSALGDEEAFNATVSALAGTANVGPDWKERWRPTEAFCDRWSRLGAQREILDGRRTRFEEEGAGADAYFGDAEIKPDGPPGCVSAGRVERMAACPFRYAVQSYAQLESTGSPDEAPDRMEEGSWAHAALELLYGPYRQRPAPPVEKLQREVEKRVAEAWEKERGNRNESFRTEATLLKRIMTQNLKRYLAAERELGESFVVEEIEWKFGLNGKPPLALTDGEKRVEISGVIDRIDRVGEEGKLRVVEYKNAKGGSGDAYDRRFKTPGVEGFQLGLYLLAAAQRLEGAEVNDVDHRPDVDGIMGFLRSLEKPKSTLGGGRSKFDFWEAMGYGQTEGESFIQRAIDRVTRQHEGIWPPNPAHPEVCDGCDMRRLCRRDLDG